MERYSLPNICRDQYPHNYCSHSEGQIQILEDFLISQEETIQMALKLFLSGAPLFLSSSIPTQLYEAMIWISFDKKVSFLLLH